MPKLKVEIMGAKKETNKNPIITLRANHDFNIVRFMNINDDFNWELVATRKENHEQDMFDYGFNHLITLDKMFLTIPKSPKDMLIVNKEKKYVLLKLCGKEFKVECHKDDKFEWLIGFGLALSKFYGNWNKSKNAREYYRNPKTHKLKYKEYAKWCVCEFFMNDITKIGNLQNKVKEINEYGKVDL